MVVRIEKKVYNSKSRQGQYIYIKEPGKRARILKATPGVPDSFYEYAYHNKLPWRTLAQATGIFTSIKRGRAFTINSKLRKGMTEYRTSIQDLATESGQRRAYAALLGPLLKDKGLLRLIIANSSKLRNKFSYRIEGHVSTGATTTTGLQILDIGRRNIEEFTNLYYHKLRIRTGKVISNQDDFKDIVTAKAGIARRNVRIHETGKRMLKVEVLVRFIQ